MKPLLCLSAALVLLYAGIGEAQDTAAITGQVELYTQGKKKKLSSREVADAVVYFEPRRPVTVKPLAESAIMVTRNKAFEPGVLAIPRGSAVKFPNQDPILHNVFSVTTGNRFDLGFYQKGPGKEYIFEKSGLVRVFCNVHYQMIGHILVLDTPYFASPDATGRFRLSGLPRGPGKLTVWHERAAAVTVEITVPHSGAIPVALEIARPRLVPHTNKLGKPYQRRGGGNRYD
jgi:plastocyanin